MILETPEGIPVGYRFSKTCPHCEGDWTEGYPDLTDKKLFKILKNVTHTDIKDSPIGGNVSVWGIKCWSCGESFVQINHYAQEFYDAKKRYGIV